MTIVIRPPSKWKIALLLVGTGLLGALVERRLHWNSGVARGLVAVALGLAFWSWRLGQGARPNRD